MLSLSVDTSYMHNISDKYTPQASQTDLTRPITHLQAAAMYQITGFLARIIYSLVGEV